MRDAKVKAIIELVGALAVLVGLVFVGLELRQNTAAIQAATFAGYTDGAIDWLSDVTNSAELSDIWYRFGSGANDLNDVELGRAQMLLRQQWFRYQNAYSQRQRDALSDADWEVARKQICRDPNREESEDEAGLSARNFAVIRQDTWPQHRPYVNQEFIDFVEGSECWDLNSSVFE
jgi:hypothetical protein